MKTPMPCEDNMTNDSLTHHFARSLFTSNEAGETGHEVIDVYLDPKTMTFSIAVPEYLAKAPVDGAADKLAGVAFGDMAGQWEKLNELYSRWKLNALATSMLLIDVITMEGPSPNCCMLSFAVREAMVTKDGRHVSIEGNPWIDVTNLVGVLVPNEPAIKGKLDTMMKSFTTAAFLMTDMLKTDDPADYLRKLVVPGLEAAGPLDDLPAVATAGATTNPVEDDGEL